MKDFSVAVKCAFDCSYFKNENRSVQNTFTYFIDIVMQENLLLRELGQDEQKPRDHSSNIIFN